ncbi:serine hydrolase [Streptomyces sp. NPDC006645]|uniref:serine hydrolase n=1 Tax=unclassified Streptomyces TaxID=2593676 RepID=UPI0033B2F448
MSKSPSGSAEPEGGLSAGADRETPAQPGATAEEPGVDRKTAVFKALKPQAEGAPARSASAPKGDADPAAPGGASGQKPVAGPADAAPESGADGEEPGVDRKTAVFRALRTDSAPAKPGTAPDGDLAPVKPGTAPDGDLAPAKPDTAPGSDSAPGGGKPVDQPTAMLKLPPQAPEVPAERTSKFVPLRADEVRVPAKPAGGPVVEAERTRQQPMPPLPPLDLLAELTNKPAPPETPTRTVVRRVKIWTPLLVLVLIIFAVVQAVRPLPAPSLNLTANSAYTFEGDKPALPWPGEGQGYMAATGLGTVDSFGEQKAVPIGSVAKAMTAYVVLKDRSLKPGAKGPSITVDAKAEEDGGLDAQGESTLNTVKEGDKLTLHDALAALMIPSANNIARLLARWDANGSEEEFVKKMNDTAEELGMKNTKYTDPSGLDATTVSSAEDQVKLGQKLVEIQALMDITKLPEWTDPSGKTWRNYNTLVPYDGALGIKTGSTTKAGGNLLFAAHKMVGDTDQLIVGAILGQHKAPIIDTVNAASKEVMRATQDELDGATIVKKGQVVGEVDNGLGTTVPLVAVEDVKAVGWSGLTVKLELTEGAKAVPQSAAAGTHVGTLTVGEGKSQVEVAVALQSDLAEASFLDKLTRVG